MKYLFLLSFVFNIQAATIYCSNGDCHPQDSNSEIVFTNGDSNQTVLWINSILDGILSIETPNANYPRDSKIFIKNLDLTKNLNVEVGSSIAGVSGANTDIYSDVFNSIYLNASGKGGQNGKSSSEICADNFKNGSLGTNASNYWNNNRDPMLSQTSCSTEDLTWMDQQFSCPNGFSEQVNDAVSVTRIEKKNKCISNYYRNRCIKRTYDVSCRYDIIRRVRDDQTYELKDHYGYYFPNIYGSTYDSSRYSEINSGYYKSGRYFDITYRISEKRMNSFTTKEELCADLLDNGTKFDAYWNESFDNNGIWETIHVNSYNVSFDDGATQRQFHFPLPDSGLDSKGNSINLSKARVLIKSLTINGFYYEDKYIDFRKAFTNCIGLNGTSVTDYICDRIPGPAFSFTYNIIDEYGAISQNLTVNVPEGRYTYILHSKPMTISGGWMSGYISSDPSLYVTNFGGRWNCGHPWADAYGNPPCNIGFRVWPSGMSSGYLIVGWNAVYGYVPLFVYNSDDGYTAKVMFQLCDSNMLDNKRGANISTCNSTTTALYPNATFTDRFGGSFKTWNMQYYDYLGAPSTYYDTGGQGYAGGGQSSAYGGGYSSEKYYY